MMDRIRVQRVRMQWLAASALVRPLETSETAVDQDGWSKAHCTETYEIVTGRRRYAHRPTARAERERNRRGAADETSTFSAVCERAPCRL